MKITLTQYLIQILDHRFLGFRHSSIAIASILLSLEFKGKEWEEFRADWFTFLCKILG
jgi:hypothetical protein